MKKIKLDIVALSHSVAQSSSYAVVLGEQRGSRRLPIVIGSFEAQAIAVAMERMTPNRPLTHDLLKNVLDIFQADLVEIIINNLQDGIFFSKLICVQNGETIEIDSRTSDALAMSVRFDCPIYTYEFILDRAGVVMEEIETEEGDEALVGRQEVASGRRLSSYSEDDLKSMLEEVLANEDYERAAEIRDEINRRSQQ